MNEKTLDAQELYINEMFYLEIEDEDITKAPIELLKSVNDALNIIAENINEKI